MSRELLCGKAPKRTQGFGAQSMTTPQMKKFIETEGTQVAKDALARISGPVGRGQLCAIFHMFRKGREEIAKGDVPNTFRLTPTPNRSRRPSPSLSSPNYSPEKILKIFAFTKATERRRLLKAGLKGLRPKGVVVRRVGGVFVKSYPRRKRVVSSSSSSNRNNTNNLRANGSGSGSNKSQGSNYGVSGSGSNRNNAKNFQPMPKYKEKEPKKAKPASRFAKKMNVKPASKFSRVNMKRRFMKRRATQFLQFPTFESSLARIPTNVRHYMPGSRSGHSKSHLRIASNARWRAYNKMVRENPNMSSPNRAALANRLLKEALVNVKVPVSVPRAPQPSARQLVQSLGLGSSSNSSASPKAKRVQQRIMRKLSKKLNNPRVNIANNWERSMLKGPQGNKVSLRKTAEERARIKELEARYRKTAGSGSGSSGSSSSASPSPKKKVSAKASSMKSLRKK